MNKELIEQIQEAFQAQRDTIERQKQITQSREKEIAAKNNEIARLKVLLNQLAEAQAQELQALPTLFRKLEHSIEKTITEYQALENAQTARHTSQLELTKQLTTAVNRQLVLTKALTSYQQDMTNLDVLKSDAKMLDQKLSSIQKTQSQENSASNDLSKTQKEIERQVQDLSELLQKL